MLLQWLLQVSLFILVANALRCHSLLGNAIRAADCQVALNLLITKLKLIPPYNTNFETAQTTFRSDSYGDPRYKMPQGAQYDSCAIAVDIHPATSAVASWVDLFRQLDLLISACPLGQASSPRVYGVGGTSSLRSFTFLVIDPGQGMQNIVGTCMTPRPPHTFGLVWHVAERLCGFQLVQQLFPRPDTSQLPPPPVLFPLAVMFRNLGLMSYRVRGQWLWNADAWSPTIGNPFTPRLNVRQLWLLMTAGRIPTFSLNPSPPPFSRTIPRVMAAAWAQPHGSPRLIFRGAWGSRAATWIALSGDLTNLQALLQTYDWLLIEVGADRYLAETGTSTSSQQASTTVTGVYALLPQNRLLRASASDPGMPQSSMANQMMGSPSDEGSVVGRRPGLRINPGPAANAPSGLNPMRIEAAGGSRPLMTPVASMIPFPALTPTMLEDLLAYSSALALGLGSELISPFQALQTPSTAVAQPGRVLPPQHMNTPELNIVTNDSFWNLDARPSKRPRPGP